MRNNTWGCLWLESFSQISQLPICAILHDSVCLEDLWLIRTVDLSYSARSKSSTPIQSFTWKARLWAFIHFFFCNAYHIGVLSLDDRFDRMIVCKRPSSSFPKITWSPQIKSRKKCAMENFVCNRPMHGYAKSNPIQWVVISVLIFPNRIQSRDERQSASFLEDIFLASLLLRPSLLETHSALSDNCRTADWRSMINTSEMKWHNRGPVIVLQWKKIHCF